MKSPPHGRRPAARWLPGALLALPLLFPASAHASMFKGEALDKVADVMTWIVLIVAPIVGIIVFLAIHILPEKIAEKKQHPQVKAIQCLCLLSLVFGGLLWPIAWLWTYTKPVLHQLAYGTDKVAHGPEDDAHPSPAKDEANELKQLRKRVAELETKLAGKSAAEGGKA
jgi:cytochrome bd-type quinol oxidase subunit 2